MVLRTIVVSMLCATCAIGCADDPAGVTATKVDGVWIFSGPPPTDVRDALFSGVPAVVGDCLMIGSGIVVWQSTDLDAVPAVIAAARAGKTSKVNVGGDLLRDWESKSSSSAPPMRMPRVIREKCTTNDETVVWEAASGPSMN